MPLLDTRSVMRRQMSAAHAVTPAGGVRRSRYLRHKHAMLLR